MTSTRSKEIGTRGETAFARHARLRGFPDADRIVLAGGKDKGDVRLTPGLAGGVIAQLKCGHTAQISSPPLQRRWAAATNEQRANAGAQVGLLVVQRLDRQTPGPGGWSAYLPLATVTELVDATSHILRDDAAPYRARQVLAGALVGMSVDEALLLLRWAGYGTALAGDSEAAR